MPNGGLAPNQDEREFQAPEGGYQPAIEFTMPAEGIDGRWQDRLDERYFVKLANGHYARMSIQVTAGSNHFAVVESYYNPGGSRNLEYDPRREVEE